MTIRFKLTLWFVAVLLLVNSILSYLMLDHVQQLWILEVQERVRLDLLAARAEYLSRGEEIAALLHGTVLSNELTESLHAGKSDAIQACLKRLHRAQPLDLSAVYDKQGRAVAVGSGRPTEGISPNPLVEAVFRDQAVHVGTIRVAGGDLARYAPALAARARVELVAAPGEAGLPQRVRDDGLVLAAAVPVRSADGQVLGVLLGGDLLNRSSKLVDAIRERVLTDDVYQGKPVSTVTVFLDDLRVATNVLLPDGNRAWGTRLSGEVYDQVLTRGETWSGPALVLGQWHMSAYEPIRDPQGKVIGALYVGLLREPFLRERNATAIRFLLTVTGTTIVSLGLLLLVAMVVLRPVSKIVKMARRVVSGDLAARVGIRPPGELGVLCRAIDAMADAVAEREQRLQVATRQQIGRSEKLASIGRLAAGIAHEINNPLTGVLTLAHLLREKANMDEQDLQDLDMIILETTRTSEIVRGLLDFARERPARKDRLDLNDAVQRTVRLLRGQKPFRKIEIVLDLGDHLPDIDGDVNQLQQVLVNLALNSSAAMPDGGTLSIRTFADGGLVLMRVADTGCGIKPEHLDKIFDPFFTTKPVGEGTGLGLSVSYGIVEQHGGTIEVESEPGKGTVFTLAFPAAELSTSPVFPDESADWGL